MSFGTNLQYLCQLSGGMTQEALAEKLNVSRQTISKWESDALERVYMIAKENGDASPKVIGWDFPHLSQEQRQVYEGVIPCFETDGESMDVYIACE